MFDLDSHAIFRWENAVEGDDFACCHMVKHFCYMFVVVAATSVEGN